MGRSAYLEGSFLTGAPPRTPMEDMMMNISPETRLAIDPQLCLRNDVDRAVLITRPIPLCERNDFFSFLHPSEALALSLFDGERTVEEVQALWADLTDKPVHAGAEEVERLIRHYSDLPNGNGSAFVEVDGHGADHGNGNGLIRYDPRDFIVPKNRVNLTDARFRKPYKVYYLPTMFCPQKCIYCYANTCSKPESNLISRERLREIFQELGSLGVDVVNLSGGDPLARRDIFEIIAEILEAGMTPYIPTKTGLSFRHARKLHELGLKVLQVSLDSAVPEVLDRMVGVRGYHKRAFRLLDDLRRAGLRIRVNCVLTPDNLPTIESLIDYLGELGNVERLTVTPYSRSLFCHRDGLFVDGDELAALRQRARERARPYESMQVVVTDATPAPPEDKKQRARQWKQRAYCTANRHGFVILPDGMVTVCEELYDHPAFIIGDLTRQSVMEMWNSPEARGLLRPDQSRVPDGPCKSCGHFAECNADRGRCWRDVLKSYGWGKPHYPDPRCPRAPQGLRLG